MKYNITVTKVKFKVKLDIIFNLFQQSDNQNFRYFDVLKSLKPTAFEKNKTKSIGKIIPKSTSAINHVKR